MVYGGRCRVKRLLLLFIVILVSVTAAAQDAMTLKTVANEVGQQSLNDRTLRSIFSWSTPQLSFVLNEKQKVGKLQYGATSGENAWSIAVAGPLDENSETVLATAEGINNGVNVELSYKRAFFTNDNPPIAAIALDALCKQFISDPAQVCSFNNMKKSAPREVRHALEDILKNADWGAKWYLGFSAKGGRKKFQYADATTLKDTDIVRNGHSIGVAAAVITSFGPRFQSAALTIRRENAYKSKNPVQICVPTSVPPAETCKSRPFGAPERGEKTLVELESRHYFGTLFALAPRLTWADTDDKGVLGVELPIYIRTKLDDPFQGGLSVNWDSKDHTVSVAVFVSALSPLR